MFGEADILAERRGVRTGVDGDVGGLAVLFIANEALPAVTVFREPELPVAKERVERVVTGARRQATTSSSAVWRPLRVN